jgi:hypothetical protein
MFAWLLKTLFATFEIVGLDGQLYLRRYKILRTPWLKIYIHEIVRSDEDRALHDHPWNFTSIILKGSYVEVTPIYRARCLAGAMITRKAEDAHRLEIPEGQTTWTLVFVGKKRREWGFATNVGWIPHYAYLDWKFGKGKWKAEMD